MEADSDLAAFVEVDHGQARLGIQAAGSGQEFGALEGFEAELFLGLEAELLEARGDLLAGQALAPALEEAEALDDREQGDGLEGGKGQGRLALACPARLGGQDLRHTLLDGAEVRGQACQGSQGAFRQAGRGSIAPSRGDTKAELEELL